MRIHRFREELDEGGKNKIFKEEKRREQKGKRVARSGGLDSFWKRMQLIRSQAILPGESLLVEYPSYWPGFCSC